MFHLYPYERFRSNLGSLKKTISEERDRLEFDLVAVQKESKAFPRPERTSRGIPFYDTSKAREKLLEHAKDGTLLRYRGKALELKNTCSEYKEEFGPAEFRKHVNNERQRKLGAAGWQIRRNIECSMNHHSRYAQD